MSESAVCSAAPRLRVLVRSRHDGLALGRQTALLEPAPQLAGGWSAGVDLSATFRLDLQGSQYRYYAIHCQQRTGKKIDQGCDSTKLNRTLSGLRLKRKQGQRMLILFV